MPKSISFRTPSSRSMTFSGLRSRCTTPAWWAWASATGDLVDRTAAASSGGQQRSRSTKARRVSPADELRHQEGFRHGGVRDVEDFDNVGVVQAGHRAGLALQPTARVALLQKQVRVEHLHRHFALQRGVEPPVDDAHAARPQELEQPVAAQLAPGEAHASLKRRNTHPARPRSAPKGTWGDGQQRTAGGGGTLGAALATAAMRSLTSPS